MMGQHLQPSFGWTGSGYRKRFRMCMCRLGCTISLVHVHLLGLTVGLFSSDCHINLAFLLLTVPIVQHCLSSVKICCFSINCSNMMLTKLSNGRDSMNVSFLSCCVFASPHSCYRRWRFSTKVRVWTTLTAKINVRSSVVLGSFFSLSIIVLEQQIWAWSFWRLLLLSTLIAFVSPVHR